MKRTTILALLGMVIGALTISLIGCDLSGVTIDARIDSFISDINYDRTNVYLNFHSSATSDYNALKNESTLEAIFPVAGFPYSRGSLDTSDPNNVTTVLDDTAAWGPKDAIFVMIKDGMTWYINDLWLSGTWVIQ